MENQERLLVTLSRHMTQACAEKMLAELREHFDDPVAATNEFIRHISRLTKHHLFSGWEDFRVFCLARRTADGWRKIAAASVYAYFFEADNPAELDALIESEELGSPRFSSDRWKHECFVRRNA